MNHIVRLLAALWTDKSLFAVDYVLFQQMGFGVLRGHLSCSGAPQGTAAHTAPRWPSRKTEHPFVAVFTAFFLFRHLYIGTTPFLVAARLPRRVRLSVQLSGTRSTATLVRLMVLNTIVKVPPSKLFEYVHNPFLITTRKRTYPHHSASSTP